jgi:F0F1-type ATP synthase assembly protein I
MKSKLIALVIVLCFYIPLTVQGLSIKEESLIFFLPHPYFFVWLICFGWIMHALLFEVERRIAKNR